MESWQISWKRVITCFYIRLGTFTLIPCRVAGIILYFSSYEETKTKWLPYGYHNEASWLICVICWDIVKGTFFRGWGHRTDYITWEKVQLVFTNVSKFNIFSAVMINSVCLIENKQYLMQILDLCLVTICLFIRPQKTTLCDCSCKVTGIMIANPQISDLLATLELLTSVTDAITL